MYYKLYLGPWEPCLRDYEMGIITVIEQSGNVEIGGEDTGSETTKYSTYLWFPDISRSTVFHKDGTPS